MQYDPSNKILTMSQTDIEHCGFDWGEFELDVDYGYAGHSSSWLPS